MSRILITGGTSGLGLILKSKLEKTNPGHHVFSLANDCHADVWCDVRSSTEVKEAAERIQQSGGIDILINNAGINRIGYIEDFDEVEWDRVVDTNAKGIYNCSKYFLGQIARSKGTRTILNIVSNASHMPMTGSIAYNASKAAAEIMTRQMARELFPRHGITVFGISPNKLSGTGMSAYIDSVVPAQRGWTFEQAKEYQLKGLAIGEETDPKTLANFITYLLGKKERHKYFHGCIIPYGL